MDEKLKNEWMDMIIDEENNLTTEELYSLIHPNSKKEYFDLVDNIVSSHSLKEGEGVEGKEVFTQAYRRRFKITAIKYFIEHEKDNAQVDLTLPYTIRPDTIPWSSDVIYCTASTK